MAASVGILTQTGGVTSHAAVVARGMNKTCVVGAEKLKIGGPATKEKSVFPVQEGERVTIDGSTGNIWLEIKVPVIRGEIAEHVAEMIGWSSELRSATGGRGSSSLMDQLFERLPSELQDKIIRQIRDRKGLTEGQIGA